MRREEVEQFRVHERLAAEDAEERVPVFFCVSDRAIERVEIDLRALGLHVHPAALAAQVAGVQNREVEEGRKIFAALDAALEFFDREQALHAEIPQELPEQPHIGRAEDAEGELWKHGRAEWSIRAAFQKETSSVIAAAAAPRLSGVQRMERRRPRRPVRSVANPSRGRAAARRGDRA